MKVPERSTLISLFLSAAFCLALPLVWNHALPRLADEDPLRLVHSWRTPTIEITRPGSYSVYGVSGNTDTRPLDVYIGKEQISDIAFYANTGSRTGNFVRQRIATGVQLEVGEHRIGLVDHTYPDIRGRHLEFEFRREEPLGPLQYLGIVCLCAAGLAIRRVLIDRSSASPAMRVITTLAVATALTLLPIVWWAWQEGAALRTLDRADALRHRRLDALEAYLASDEHQSAVEQDRFSVFVMGDSTHFWPHPEDREMLPSIRRAIPTPQRDQIEIYGIAFGAGGAFDFMFLLQRIVEKSPDLVVIPVNLRGFGAHWAAGDPDFSRIEQYLHLDDLTDTLGLSFGARSFGWRRALTSTLDTWLFASNAGPFLHGATHYAGAARDFWIESWIPAALQAPAPEHPLTPSESMRRVWPADISDDGREIDAFRRINRVAARHRTRVLYYTAEPNVTAIRRAGFDLDARGMFARIGAWIATDPHIDYLDLGSETAEEMFADVSDHLSKEGMEQVSRRLARAIVDRAAQARAERASSGRSIRSGE